MGNPFCVSRVIQIKSVPRWNISKRLLCVTSSLSPREQGPKPHRNKCMCQQAEGARDKPWAGSHQSLQGQLCCSCSLPLGTFWDACHISPQPLLHIPELTPLGCPQGSPHRWGAGSPHTGNLWRNPSWGKAVSSTSAHCSLCEPRWLPPQWGDRSPSPPSHH